MGIQVVHSFNSTGLTLVCINNSYNIFCVVGIVMYILDSQSSSGGVLNMSGCARTKLQSATRGQQHDTEIHSGNQRQTLASNPSLSTSAARSRTKNFSKT